MKRTSLFEKQLALKAKMVSFAGWEMPVSYPAGIIAEHLAVRKTCGVFDIGHMGIIKIKDKNEKRKAEEFLNKIATNDVSGLADFSSQYSVVCNEQGGVIDDILVYKLPGYFFVIANASNAEKVLRWFSARAEGVTIEQLSNLMLLAIQGPSSLTKAEQLFGSAARLKDLPRNHCVWVEDILVSHTGYTGEKGLELFVPTEKAGELWDKIIDLKIQPCGLGSRDTLRVEAGLPLYGHEYTEEISPLEAGYGWAVKFEKKEFIGKEKLFEQKEHKPAKKLVGIIFHGKAVPRGGSKIYDGAELIGQATSGTYSPVLEKPIALAYINYGFMKSEVQAEVRGIKVPGTIIALPFYKHA